jgi:hypothetical protein
MAFSRNENLIEDVGNDLDPTFNGVNEIHAPAETKPVKLEKNPNIDFITLKISVGATPVRILGQDPARLRTLVSSQNGNVLYLGTNADVSQGKGFVPPLYSSGSIELQTTQEVWSVAPASADVLFIYVERQSDV